MIRAIFQIGLVGVLGLPACDRSQGVPDQDLGALVIAPRSTDLPVDVTLASKEPAELGRALLRPYKATIAALGAHLLTVTTATTVEEAGKPVDDRNDKTTLALGDGDSYHATYENSADYGREVIFLGGRFYLRPRYQRWHERGPEAPDEPITLRDQFTEAIGATWDLLAPGAELSDLGPAEVAGRAGRKIAVKLSPHTASPPSESVSQRKWRERRTIEAVTGEVVLDVEKGVPLAVKLAGTIGFSRDGRTFKLKLSVDSTVASIGTKSAITAPAKADVVATPERMREVDDRDFLLQGIAPPIRKTVDGTAVPPQPAPPAAAKPDDKPPEAKPPTDDKPKKKKQHVDDSEKSDTDKKPVEPPKSEEPVPSKEPP